MIRANARGVTFIEVLVVVTAALLLVCLVLPFGARARGEDQQAACRRNCMEVIKCCHLYSDAAPNLGFFPVYVGSKDLTSETGDGHTQNGRMAISQLYNGYIRKPELFSCPGKPTDTSVLKPYEPAKAPKVADFTNYGYDPGHNPVHATAGVFGDLGALSPKNGNSTNHGEQAPGQTVTIGAGSVEWWNSASRNTRDANNRAIKDDIYAANINADNFPEELETHIVK